MASCTLTGRLLCLAVLLAGASSSRAAEQTTGPENGTLVIVGGGDREYVVFKHFAELAGGKDAKLVVIPTASSSSPDHDYAANKAAHYAHQDLGMPNVTIVHTHDRAEADSEDFVQPIREADAVWFGGGRQWRIADAYLGTLAEEEFRGVLERGGIAGVGQPQIKARLKDGVVHRMDKETADQDPLRTKIGDRQYQHFTFDVEPAATDVQVELVGSGEFHLNLYLHRDSPAFCNNSTFSNTSPGTTKRIRKSLTPGRWFASVECSTTVDAVLHETQSFFIYTGETDVLNGVPYSIAMEKCDGSAAAK